jgi:hypothetical protein
MNTNQLKKFAKEARTKLITQIGVKLDFVLTQDSAELRGKSNELAQIRSKLSELGREQLIETVAYTWFNRLMALRFMDANGYNTPKVVTPLPGMSNPEILQNALAGNIEDELKLDRQRLNDLIDGRTSSSDAQTEAFKLLLVASCNKWHTAMPFMFERISDYTELLLPDDLLSDFSIVSDIRNGMSDDDCQQEELIGWLYQFYISDKKDDVFEGLKKNIKITAENIPAATQLFTPRWIVRYMVENTLGKLWLTFKPESNLRQHMPYFIESDERNIPTPIPEGINSITDITFLDPCLGSGHVLVYAFDLFAKIYEEEGFNTNEIPSLILNHNLFGIDIDIRAAQLAAFALTMKSRKYYSRFLRKPLLPNVIALENVSEKVIIDSIKLPISVKGKLIYDHRDLSIFNLTQAKNLGSLIQIDSDELNSLQIQKGSIWEYQEQKIIVQAEFLGRRYHCVSTNPPYLGQTGMNDSLKIFIEQNYKEAKADLMTCFMQRCSLFIYENCRYGMINLPSWLFIRSFEELRKDIITNYHIDSLIHMGRGIFGIDFGSVAFIISRSKSIANGTYFRLHERNFQHIYYNHIEQLFLRAKSNADFKYNFNDYRDDDGVSEIPTTSNAQGLKLFYSTNQENFNLIPSFPIGYWLSEEVLKVFDTKSLYEYADPRLGMATADNSKFVRFFWEIDINNFNRSATNINEAIESRKKWFIYSKGGDFRKWYGNNEHVVNWHNNGEEIRTFTDQKGKIRSHNYNIEYIFKPGITWNALSSNKTSFRLLNNSLFDNAGSSLFPFSSENNLYILGVLNSKIIDLLIPVINPTLNYQPGTIGKLPIKINDKKNIEELVQSCILLCRDEQKSIETSIDFEKNIIFKLENNLIEDAFNEISKITKSNRNKIGEYETEINTSLINTYNLFNEITPNISNDELTIYSEFYTENNFSNSKFLNSFLSISIGHFFGRFSIDKSGLILANKEETLNDFLKLVNKPTFVPDEDNIIPVLDGEWFNDDIVGVFKVFLKSTFGEEYLEENLRFIEKTVEKDIRKYFVKDFYNDHIKRFKKRPIYWMFSSPKGHFKALIYMHRYQPDLCSKMLNDYLQPFISKLEATKQTNTLLALREDVTAREKTIALKEVDRLELMIRDCKDYERTLFTIATQKITIDLDDGVKVNYLKFKEVLVPIKGLEKEED